MNAKNTKILEQNVWQQAPVYSIWYWNIVISYFLAKLYMGFCLFLTIRDAHDRWSRFWQRSRGLEIVRMHTDLSSYACHTSKHLCTERTISKSSMFCHQRLTLQLTLGKHTYFSNQEEHSGSIWPCVLYNFIPFQIYLSD